MSLPEKWKEAIRKKLVSYCTEDDAHDQPPCGTCDAIASDITVALTKLREEQQAQAQREMGTVLTILFGKLRGAAWNAVHEDYPEVAEKVARHDAELRKLVLQEVFNYWDSENVDSGDVWDWLLEQIADKPESTVREKP